MGDRQGRKPAALLGAAAFFAALLAVLCFAAGGRAAPALLSDPGDPGAVSAAFLDSVCAGDYEAARALCPELPAEGSCGDGDAGRVYERLRALRSWESAGACRRDGIYAAQPVRFTYLDVDALTADMQSDVNALLARRVEEAERASDVYNEDRSYRDEVVRRAWEEALDARLAAAERYTAVAEFPLGLTYENGAWRVECGAELLRALAGGAS